MLKVLLMAMLPIIELRGAIPFALSLGFSKMDAILLSIIGSTLPVPFILLLMRKISEWMKKTKLFNKIITHFIDKTMKHQKTIDRYGYIGLYFLVAIPLPGTGVWTGSFLASLLAMPFFKSITAIILGNLTAGIIVLFVSLGIGGLL